MTSKTCLLLIKNGVTFDVSNLVESIKWGGRKGTASRTLTVTFLDDDGYKHARTGLDVEEGHQCIFLWEGQERFRGMFMRQGQNKSKLMTAVAYDSGIYLSGNRDTFNYSDKTASYVFMDCCNRFGIPYGNVADTGYRIPELPLPKRTGFNAISEALSLTYKANRTRYYPISMEGKMHLLKRRDNVFPVTLEIGKNIEDYQYNKSIENIKTRVKLLSESGTVLAEARDYNLEKKIGIFQDVEQPDDTLNSARLNELVNSVLSDKKVPEKTLTLTTLGIPDAVSGMCFCVVVKHLGISKPFYIEEDSHTFKGNYHGMRLSLVPFS